MGADIEQITRDMAVQATGLDAEAASLRQRAAKTLEDAQKVADDHLLRAQQMATQIIAEAKADADSLQALAQRRADFAAKVRALIEPERKAAGLDGDQVQGGPRVAMAGLAEWVGPDGRRWPLANVTYRDTAGGLWHFTGVLEQVDGVEWPVMARDDGAQAPFLRCQGLTLVVEPDPDKATAAAGQGGGQP